MHGRTCGHGRFWLRNRGHEQWRRSRNARRAGVLRSARTRLLGRWERALYFLAFFRRGRLCQPKMIGNWKARKDALRTRVELAREELTGMRPEAVRQMRIPR